jgi:transposase
LQPTFRIALSVESHFFVRPGKSFLISSPAEEMIMPEQLTYRSQVLDHLGRVAGMFDELGIGDVIDQATPQHPERRDLTAGEAVKALVRTGLGCINQALYLVPSFFQNKPTSRLIAPRVVPGQLHDDALGRAWDTLYAYGVTELYRLSAATAAQRLGLAPRLAHLDRTSFQVDGRDNSDEEPTEQVIHLTRGYRREHRPDLNHVILELIVAPQAGSPVLMKPRSGNSREAHDVGEVIRTHGQPVHITDGLTYVVADSAIYRAANLQKRAPTPMPWITRVPATFTEAPAALAHVDPQAMAPLSEHDRYGELPSSDGGVPQRWVLLYSERRQTQAQRPVDTGWRKQSDQEGNAWKRLGRTTVACEAAARQALAACGHTLQATVLAPGTVYARPRDGQRGRPARDAPPDQVVYHLDGALASSLTSRQALIAQHRCFLLATNELDASSLPPPALLQGDKGQVHAERGFRFLKDPQFFASAR